ncbi:MAG: penicillin acylase family protein, partial [Chloroflexi bacterium]|nr:penicillin acylase family protein [Chloroflexota bacterium]
MFRLIKRILLVVISILLLLVVAGVGAGYWFITKSLPQTSGTLQLAGLKSSVIVIRDQNGVPHLYGDSESDLYMAQGYVHAQDRLWQMEMNRAIGHGRLAELFGADYVDEDSFLRTMGLARAAQRDADAADPATRARLEKYAQGVNAFIHTHLDNLPIEFALLNHKPQDWQPVDTHVWGKVMAYNLGGNYERELLRAALQKELGGAAMRALIPEYPANGPFIIPPDVKNYASPLSPLLNSTSVNSGEGKSDVGRVALVSNRSVNSGEGKSDVGRVALVSNRSVNSGEGKSDVGAPKFSKLVALNALFDTFEEGVGSNNWVVDGTKTTTGKPLLANDPHLRIQMPSIWYTNALHCNTISETCPFNVVGYAFPGVPGVIIGHNDWIAWGVTNVNPDVQDLFIEKINPANPNQYEYVGKWEDMQLVNETIHVKGAPDVNLTVKITRHGPIMTEVFKGVTEPLALQFAALREPSRLLRSVPAINAARNWDEFRAALRDWDAPAQNFVYADAQGNIGYQMPGNIPIRAQGDGTVPVPGWTGENEWTGYIPFDELPMVLNPSNHFIATANNQVAPNTYKYLITRDWSAPYRAARITELLQAQDKLSAADLAAIQGDVYSLPLVELAKYVQELPTDDFLSRRALDYVKAWDGKMTHDAQAPAILEATFHALVS